MKFDKAYFQDIKRNLVRRVKERQQAERLLHPPKPKRAPRTHQRRSFRVNWMAYRLSGSGNTRRIHYKLPNNVEVRHTSRMGIRACHIAALNLSRELRNCPNLMAELIPSSPTGGIANGQ